MTRILNDQRAALMPARICAFERCNDATLRGEKFCSEHNHKAALQTEIERLKTLIPLGLRELKAAFGPELENLLSSLARLLTAADPSKASTLGGGSPTARLKDAWAGQSQLDERGDHVVTHRGATSTEYARSVLLRRFRERLGNLADDIIGDLNPDLKQRRKVVRPRCGTRGCRLYDRRQDPGGVFCTACGNPFRTEEKGNPVTAITTRGKVL